MVHLPTDTLLPPPQPTTQTVASGGAAAEKSGAWKWAIRKRVWDHLEENDIADFPRPVHHRIPNFKGAEEAARQLASLPQFQEGKVIKVNPDTPQKARNGGFHGAGCCYH